MCPQKKEGTALLEPSHGHGAALGIKAFAHPKAATIPGHALDPATSTKHHHLKNEMPL